MDIFFAVSVILTLLVKYGCDDKSACQDIAELL
jgi:hypothetical protein